MTIDGSEQSMKAAEYAIEIAKENNAQLIAFTVLNISKIRYTSYAFIRSPLYGLKEMERMRKEAQQWLDKVGKLASQKDNKNNIQF